MEEQARLGWGSKSAWLDFGTLALALPMLLLQTGECPSQSPTPTPAPNCVVAAEILPLDPIYFPGVPFELTFRAQSGDWPTTPSSVHWVDPSGIDIFDGNSNQTFLIDGEPDIALIRVAASGRGPLPECMSWATGYSSTNVRRFDATPIPPSPTPTPLPTCTPAPDLHCADAIIHPVFGAENLPLTVQIEWQNLSPINNREPFLGIEESRGGGSYIQTRKIRDGLWEVSNLKPNTSYIWYLVLWMRYCGTNEVGEMISIEEYGAVCFAVFRTGDFPVTPTPEPSPTSPSEGWILSEQLREGIRERVATGEASGHSDAQLRSSAGQIAVP